MLDKFALQWEQTYPGLDCILFVDNCSVHRSDVITGETIESNLVLRLALRGIWVFFLPPNTTHWLQPLDDLAIGTFKNVLNQKNSDLCFSTALHENADGKIDLQDVCEAEVQAFTKPVIRRSWTNTGLAREDDPSQINEARILERAHSAFGVSSGPASSTVEKARDLALAVIHSTPRRSPRNHTEFPIPQDKCLNADELSLQRNIHRNFLEQRRIERENLAIAEEKAAEERRERRKELKELKMSRQTFLDAERQRKRAQREFEKIEKKEQQSRNTCKSCGRYWKGGPGWKECESCPYYSRCSKCSLNPLPMKEHEKNCRKNRSKK